MSFGTPIIQVEPGTVIEHDGETLTVTDTQAVSKLGKIYVTAHQLEAIKRATQPPPTKTRG